MIFGIICLHFQFPASGLEAYGLEATPVGRN